MDMMDDHCPQMYSYMICKFFILNIFLYNQTNTIIYYKINILDYIIVGYDI